MEGIAKGKLFCRRKKKSSRSSTKGQVGRWERMRRRGKKDIGRGEREGAHKRAQQIHMNEAWHTEWSLKTMISLIFILKEKH